MIIYKVFKNREGKELIGMLPERRSKERVTEESIEKYVKSIFGSHLSNGQINLKAETVET